jgi:hypothetical protein
MSPLSEKCEGFASTVVSAELVTRTVCFQILRFIVAPRVAGVEIRSLVRVVNRFVLRLRNNQGSAPFGRSRGTRFGPRCAASRSHFVASLAGQRQQLRSASVPEIGGVVGSSSGGAHFVVSNRSESTAQVLRSCFHSSALPNKSLEPTPVTKARFVSIGSGAAQLKR